MQYKDTFDRGIILAGDLVCWIVVRALSTGERKAPNGGVCRVMYTNTKKE